MQIFFLLKKKSTSDHDADDPIILGTQGPPPTHIVCGGGRRRWLAKLQLFVNLRLQKVGGKEGSKGRRVEGSKGPFFFQWYWVLSFKGPADQGIFCSEATLRIFLGCFATVIEGFLIKSFLLLHPSFAQFIAPENYPSKGSCARGLFSGAMNQTKNFS